MPGSGEHVDYSIRPAKHVERKMMCEAFRRLSALGPVKDYRYVGLGSFYFADFVLFHKSLGITNMCSIEADPDAAPRCEFNRPFGCIEIREGHSNDELPKLAWDAPTILWLDYDGKLDESKLADVRFFCANAQPGSMLVVTVNAHMPLSSKFSEQRIRQINNKELTRLQGHVSGRVPLDVKARDLTDWGLARVCRRIIDNEIKEWLRDRNASLGEATRLRYKQLLNFHYRDTSRMLTVGGLLYREGQEDAVARCTFEDLDFICGDSERYLIEVPYLTYLERRHLDQRRIAAEVASPDTSGIPKDHADAYGKIYRYFPAFAEVEL